MVGLTPEVHVWWQALSVLGGLILTIAGIWIFRKYKTMKDLRYTSIVMIITGSLMFLGDGLIFLPSFGYNLSDVPEILLRFDWKWF